MTQDVIGSKKGGGGSSFYEADNTLQSTATVRLLEVISEGQIKGLVGGAKGIYLNNVPLQNPDDSMNYGSKVAWDARVGLPSQPYMEGFTSAAAEIPVSNEVTAATPQIYTVSDALIDALGVTIGLPQGLVFNNTADNKLLGSEVELAIERRVTGGTWALVKRFKIIGKTTNAYEETHRVERPPNTTGLWEVRVVRYTPDNATSTLRNNTWFNRVTEIKNVKLEYPDTAYVGIAVDAKTLGASRVPTRSYLIDGLIVKVPVNYDPLTRVYTGQWDGTFKFAWTNNPAWILYDLHAHPRYGLGRFGLVESQLDKYSFYDAGVYADQLVDNGKGGTEPRFTFDYSLKDRQDANQWIDAIAGAMNSKVVWIGDKATVLQDRPSSVVKLITSSNVVDGKFTYKSSGLQERKTVVNVTWNDPANHYQQTVTTVEADQTLQDRYGVNSVDIAAVGATSEGQAMRAGKWFLDTSLNQPELVGFKQFLNGFDLLPNDVVSIFDERYAGAQQAGRLLAGSTRTSLLLDRPVTITPGSTISVHDTHGVVQTAPISQTSGSLAVLTLSEALRFNPTESLDFIVTTSLAPRQFKISSVRLGQDYTVDVSAIEHDPNKYSRIESGLEVPAPIFSAVPSSQVSAPVGLLFREVSVNEDNTIKRTLNVSWQAPVTGIVVNYVFKYQVSSGGWNTIETSAPSVDISPAIPGEYEVSVVGIGYNGVVGEAATGSYNLTVAGGDTSELDAPIALQTLGGASGSDFTGRDLYAQFTNPYSNEGKVTVRDFEVRIIGSTGTVLRTIYVPAVQPGQTTYFTYLFSQNQADGGPRRLFTVEVRCRDVNNNLSLPAIAVFNNPAPATLTGFSIVNGINSILVKWTQPTDPDLAGVLLWRDTAEFSPSAATVREVQGSFVADVDVTAGTTYYYKVAAYDSFSRSVDGDGLNIVSGSGIPQAEAGIPMGGDLPGTGTEGDLFFNTTNGQLYRYHSGAWTAAVPAVNVTGQLTNAQLADIAAAKVTGQLVNAQLADIAATKITGTILDAQVATLAATKITGQLTNAQLAALDATKITGQLTNAQLAALDATKLTGQITATQITDGAISTPKLAAGAVTTAALAAGAVTANTIGANAVTTAKLAAGAVTTATLAAGAVTTSTIASGAITTATLAAGAVQAANIAAGAVTTGSLLVTGQGKALNDDPSCVDTSAWSTSYTGSIAFLGDTALPIGTAKIRATNAVQIFSRLFPVEPGKTYKLALWARQVSGGGVLYIRLYCWSTTLQNYLVQNYAMAPGNYLEALGVPGTWTKYTGYITPNATVTMAQIYLHVNWATTGVTDLTDIRCEEFIGNDLIVDGSIAATKLTANSITASQIAANTITTTQIAAGGIIAANIAAGTITSTQIAADTITAANIAANAITSSELAANSVIAGKILAGAVSTNELAANAVTAAKIAANTITAANIAAGAITSNEIDSRNLTIKDGSGNIIFGASANLDFSRVAGNSKPHTYRVASVGYTATTQPANAGLYDITTTSSTLAGGNSGYNVVKYNRNTGVWTFVMNEMPLASGTGANIANALNAIGSDYIVVVYTFDEPQTNRLTGGLPAALYRCGGSRGIFESTAFAFRGAYMLIGIPNCGEGNGYEVYAGNGSSDANAWVDTTFSIVNGSPIMSGNSSSKFQLNASNIGSYVSNGAVDSSLVTPAGGWLNSNVSIGSNGVLSGAGGGQVTIPGLDNTVLRSANPITAGNISTYIAGAAIGTAYIANAAIGTAQIGDLAVSTLKIQDEAVTVPRGATLNSTVAFGTSDTTLLTVNIDTGGSPLLILFDDYYQQSFAGTQCTFRIKINGVDKRVITTMAATANGLSYRVFSSTYVQSPGTGNLAVSVTASSPSTASSWQDGFLFCIGSKK